MSESIQEEAEYFAERADKLQNKLAIAVELLTEFWGLILHSKHYKNVQARTEKLLAEIAKEDLL